MKLIITLALIATFLVGSVVGRLMGLPVVEGL